MAALLIAPCGMFGNAHPGQRDQVLDTARWAELLDRCERIYLQDPDSNRMLAELVLSEVGRYVSRTGEGAGVMVYKAKALTNKGVTLFIYGELDSALMLFAESEVIAAAHGLVTEQATAINNQGILHGVRGDHATQERCLRRALLLFRQKGDRSEEASALVNIGNFHGERGDEDSALVYLQQALVIFTEQEDQRGIASVLLNLGQQLAEQGRPGEALERLLEAERIYTTIEDHLGLATCLNNLGSLFKSHMLWVDALDHFHRSLDLHRRMGNTNGEAILLNNLGTVLEDSGEREEAHRYYVQALDRYQRVGDQVGASIVHGMLGDMMKHQGDAQQAAYHFEESLRLAWEVDRPSEIAGALYKLGVFHADQGRFPDAIELLREAYDLDLARNDPASACYTLSAWAGALLKQGHLQKAEGIARRSLELAREVGLPTPLMRATRALYEVLHSQKRWEEAASMLALHHQMKDSVLDVEQMKETLRSHLLYTYAKKQAADSMAQQARVDLLEHDRELATLRARQAQDRTWAMGLAAAVLLAGSGVVFAMDRKRRRERHARQAAQAQMRALRAQMNPHFLFNALHSLHDFILANDREASSDFLGRFTRLMRMVLEYSRQEEVTLAAELEVLGLYLELERARLKNKFTYRFEVADGVDAEGVLIPPLLLQPFVENAVWHGIAPKQGAGDIRIGAALWDAKLVITVEDDGVGRRAVAEDTNEAGSKRSLATTITRERLALFGHRHGTRSEVRLEDLAPGFRATIELPRIIAE